MRKLALAIAAIVGLAFVAAPAQPAQAETVVKKKVVIKKDRGQHVGWRRGARNKVVIVRKDRGRHLGWRRGDVRKTVIVKKRPTARRTVVRRTVIRD